MITVWASFSAARIAAKAAITVFPEPTSPWISLIVGVDFERSSNTSLVTRFWACVSLKPSLLSNFFPSCLEGPSDIVRCWLRSFLWVLFTRKCARISSNTMRCSAWLILAYVSCSDSIFGWCNASSASLSDSPRNVRLGSFSAYGIADLIQSPIRALVSPEVIR